MSNRRPSAEKVKHRALAQSAANRNCGKVGTSTPSRPPNRVSIKADISTGPPTKDTPLAPPRKPATGTISELPSNDIAPPGNDASSHRKRKLSKADITAKAQGIPKALSGRTLLFVVVGLLVTALVVPTLRGAMDQQQQLIALRDQLAAAQAESLSLDYELARWDDPVFIEAQARGRFGYVRPGDTVWRPIGGDTLTEDIDPATGLQVTAGIVGVTPGQPWFDALLESIVVAGGPIPDKPDDLDEILSRSQTQ